MDTYRNLTPRLFVMVTILALVIVVLLACGPADESVQRKVGNLPYTGQQGDVPDTPPISPTPEEPTRPETPGNYPNLDETLQAVVRQWEDGTLSERAAAASAPSYHQRTVLVSITVEWPEAPFMGSLPDTMSILDSWMKVNGVEVSHADPVNRQPLLFAYVPVSKLGPLSQQEKVTAVNSQVPWMENPSEERATRGEDMSTPVFPGWLKGYPQDGKYELLDSTLNLLMEAYHENGGSLTDEIREKKIYSCFIWEGDLLDVELYVFNEPGALDSLWAYLDRHNIDRPNPASMELFEPYGDVTVMIFLIPISHIDGILDLNIVHSIAKNQVCDYDWGIGSSSQSNEK